MFTNNFHSLSIYNKKLSITERADPRMEWHYFHKNIQDTEMHKTCNNKAHGGNSWPSLEYHKCIFWYPCDLCIWTMAVHKIVLPSNVSCISHCSIYHIYINENWKIILKKKLEMVRNFYKKKFGPISHCIKHMKNVYKMAVTHITSI